MRLKKQIAMYTGTVTLAVAALGGMPAGAAACDKVAAPQGSDSFPGTTAAPYATVEHLANALSPGQTGCVRAGVYENDVKIERGSITVTSYPGERATLLGRLQITDEANNVVIQSLNLDGRATPLPSPSVYGDGAVFRDNDVTNAHTNICFILGSDTYGRARGTVIEGNRIHNCGEMPATNHHHGIYTEASDGARITDNWIYDNADRGIQLFPDAQGTYVARNVIDGNGQGVLFSRTSANNVVEHNIITNPALRYNLEDYELSGGGNVARRNCLWSDRHKGAGLQPGLAVPVLDSLIVDPGYANRGAKDFRLPPSSPCAAFTKALQPQQAAKPRKKRKRPVRLRSSTRRVWPGGRLRLRAKVKSPSARAAASRKAVLKVRVGKKWRRVATMRLRGVRYVSKPHLGKAGRAAREFGMTRVRRHGRLKLRAYVPGVGRSNVLRVRIGK